MLSLNIFFRLLVYATVIALSNADWNDETTSTTIASLKTQRNRLDAEMQLFENKLKNHIHLYLLQNSYCEPEAFQHDYKIRGNRLQAMNNTWQRTRAGEWGSLQELCLQSNGLPITRKCVFNNKTGIAEWENISNWIRVSCLRDTQEIIVTRDLYQLRNEILSNRTELHTIDGRSNVTERMCTLLEQRDVQLLPADVHFSTQILRKLTDEAKDTKVSQDMHGMCSLLMTTGKQVLRLSSLELNATNSLLDVFETYMDDLGGTLVTKAECDVVLNTSTVIFEHAVKSINFTQIGIQAQISSNIGVFFINPECAGFTGISIYDPHVSRNNSHPGLIHETQVDFSYRFIYMNESAADIAKEPGVQVAAFLPKQLWQQVKRELNEPYIVLKVYSDDSLFIDHSKEQTFKPSSKILSITIPGHSGVFAEALPFLLRKQLKNFNGTFSANNGTGCGYWDYGKSSWKLNGVETKSTDELHDPVILCETHHLTQFSFLLGVNQRLNDDDSKDAILITALHEQTLDIISLVGCSLSLIGLLGIYITAAAFKSWRSLESTKVLLNLCVALTLQMILFVFINMRDMSEYLIMDGTYAKCVALGALLQYSILVMFTWMLIAAVLQFQRYVTVIGIRRPDNYIFISAIIAWSVPLVPTLLLVFMDSKSYIPTEQQLQEDNGICYPSGYGLLFGVVLPITLICIVNLVIFISVFYNINHTLSQSMQRQERKLLMKQIRLSVMLFFLLGLSWIFGLFAAISGGIVFSYLFCLTATIQGFILFLYFVLLDDRTRNAYSRLLCSIKSQKVENKSRELQSITASSAMEANSART